MQLEPLQGNIVERVLRDPAGRLARVTFLVYEQGGRVKARVIAVAYLAYKTASNGVLALCGYSSANKTSAPAQLFPRRAVVSPYIPSRALYISGSKPRAPSFA